MRIFSRTVLVGAALLSLWLVQNSISQDPGTAKASTFMKLKLIPAKNLLEGLARADFAAIELNADRIRKLLLDEGWMVHQTEDYRKYSKQFGKSVDLLHRAAKEQDLDSALVAYMQVTMNCVQCHEAVRDIAKR